ncbi:MAG TPA: hypothetical protein VGC13_09800 [Longimicrobium sp.]|jgi:hypothetical protein|uniref:hypothetical protein n=1 Tax=Longimicrobium sp. TaxID=2029185 RepID=UPI002ED7BB17
MEAQNQDHRPPATPGEPYARALRTFARRIDCAPQPRRPRAAQHGRGPDHARGESAD